MNISTAVIIIYRQPTKGFNVVPQPVKSEHGLLTTVAYQLGRDQPACYALEVRPRLSRYMECLQGY